MTQQPRLFDVEPPGPPTGIDLRCCDVAELLDEVRGADLVVADPPWSYRNKHVRAFCPPGGLVLDLYCGMGPYARACHAEGRNYIGSEIDPERHRAALALLAQGVGL